MLNVLLRWAIPLAALFVLGPFAWWLTLALKAPDGGGETSLLLNTSIFGGVFAAAVALLLALGIGILGAKYIEQRSGLLAAGFVLTWSAFGLGQVDRIVARAQTGSIFWTMAIECLILIPAAAVVAIIILRVPTRVPKFIAAGDQTRNLAAKSHHEPLEWKDKTVALGLLAAVVAGGVGAWLIAQDFRKGQVFAAAAVGGVFAAAAGRLAAQRVSPVVFVVGLMLLGVGGPIAAAMAHSTPTGAVRAAAAGTLIPLARPLPMHWLAGAFVGVPFGLWWAGSMLEKHEPAKR